MSQGHEFWVQTWLYSQLTGKYWANPCTLWASASLLRNKGLSVEVLGGSLEIPATPFTI